MLAIFYVKLLYKMLSILKYLLIFCIFIGCQTSPNTMFSKHVLNLDSLHTKEIQFFKDPSAMHGIMFFKFKLNSSNFEKIIKIHNLELVSSEIPVLQTINNIPSSEVDWWKPNIDMKKYAVFYEPKSGYGDWKIKYLYLDDETAYFLTSGYFEEKDYRINRKVFISEQFSN